MNEEADIIINGVPITAGMSMTLRVSIESMATELRSEGLGDDDHGKNMTRLYLENIDKLRQVMWGKL